MESIHLEVMGRVQGVGFRWFVVEKAQQDSDLAGWVRNRPDGNVEVAAAGPAEALARLESAVRAGPRGARVDEVKALAPIAVGDLRQPFEIAR